MYLHLCIDLFHCHGWTDNQAKCTARSVCGKRFPNVRRDCYKSPVLVQVILESLKVMLHWSICSDDFS